MSVFRAPRALAAILCSMSASSAFLPAPPTAVRRAASAPLDTAVARMGGETALRRIERVRFEMMTQWLRLSFDGRPNDVVAAYELHSDLRNYPMGAWRNTRRFVSGPTMRETTDIVVDTMGIRRVPRPDGTPAPWAPLNVAYVDERNEVFAFAPERLLLRARAAGDLRALTDTAIGGVLHARVSASVAGFPTTIFVRRSDGFLAMARYRAAQPNDFGLAPWGDMEVEIWYSRWARYPVAGTGDIAYPTQWDVRRVGRRYKRVTVLAANFDAAAPADSFAVSDSLRTAFFATENHPMWELPMDSARIIDRRFTMFGNPGQTQAAVKLGNRWLLLEGTSTPQRTETDSRWLSGADQGAAIGGLLITVPNAGRGGATWLVERKLPVYATAGAAAAMSAALSNWKQPRSAATVVSKPQWLRVGGDSLWVETIDYPDYPGALIAYVPSLRWVYSGMAATPLNVDLLMARVRRRGWAVDRVGSLRGVTMPVPGRTVSR